MIQKYKTFLSTLTLISTLTCNANSLEIPTFLDKNDILNAKFECLTPVVKYNKEDQKYIDILWNETLTYIKAYALALTNDENSQCLNSDKAIYDTTIEHNSICVMNRRDMKNMVKNIYQVLANPKQAKQCFAARKDVNWIYNPGGDLTKNSPVAKWANRTTFEEFFNTKVTNKEVQKLGLEFTKNFSKMVTGDDIRMPKAFPYDISANSLPNLWASVGWFPMYAQESKRNDKNFNNIRGGYAYAEILGHWGLLRINTINNEKVGAEIGMTVQAVDTLYPYHNHSISEVYYNMRVPACDNQFKSFAIQEDSHLLKTVSIDDKIRKVQFDTSRSDEPTMWVQGSAIKDSLLYFHENTIHAFELDGSCELKPHEKALVSVWARTNAHDKRNDYGTTILCESANKLGTPARRGEMIQCNLTHTKW